MPHANPHAGSDFDAFLADQDLYADATSRAIKRVLAEQLKQAMNEANLSKAEMARRLQTSRSQLDRLLDPENQTVRLDTLERAASALGRSLRIELV
jgi:predicted XRE-type DNA-binding protein